ncbi:ArsR/SmtB family transcription factor [Loktanella sp. DJP18]|uniref:ArsR/SmtB family transcription factor n=1 Tax=Loktanella sp. DJP18 TaxID=3409788 RepID=UPI003BB6D564
MSPNLLLLDAETDFETFKAAASRGGVRILKLLHDHGGMNINQIAERLGQPQSSVSNNVQSLVKAGLIRTETVSARKGSQKVCHAVYDEIVVSFHKPAPRLPSDVIEVAMPLGLYTNAAVVGPCGICSPTGIIGLLDVPATFLDPERMKASLLWFTSGFVEYQFPNNAHLKGLGVDRIEFALEVSSEVPGTHTDWPSDICLSINGVELGVWTSPGDFGDRRGVYTPDWWKLAGSQYGLLKTWQVTTEGSFVDGRKISDIGLADLKLAEHRSIRLRIEVKAQARHPGGINVFGRGFGNYDQDLILRLHTKSKVQNAIA